MTNLPTYKAVTFKIGGIILTILNAVSLIRCSTFIFLVFTATNPYRSEIIASFLKFLRACLYLPHLLGNSFS